MKFFYDFLPTYLQKLVRKLADVYQIDSDYVLAGLMLVTAASQGDRYQIIDPKGYRNALATWLILVGVSGYGKSECIKWLMSYITAEEAARHNQYLKEVAIWAKADPKERGEKPVEKKLMMNDYTPEELFKAMEYARKDGIILYRDELIGWFKDMGRYGKSGEVEQYLSAWSQQAIRVSRLNRDDNFIERPCFNVIGGIQEDLLHEYLGPHELIANGFNARWLFVFSDENISLNYFRESIPDEIKKEYYSIMERLFATQCCEVKFSSAAEKSFIQYWEDLQAKKVCANNMYRALVAKLQIYVEKWAGIIELLTNDGIPSSEISGNTMQIAIEHMKVFEEWALKAYSRINPDIVQSRESTPILSKTELLQQLVKNYPTMNKNIVAQGLGINRSAFSRKPNEASTPERNNENDVIN